jgi:hypothetical protein
MKFVPCRDTKPLSASRWEVENSSRRKNRNANFKNVDFMSERCAAGLMATLSLNETPELLEAAATLE